MMTRRGALTTDDRTRVRWVIEPSCERPQTRLPSVKTSIRKRTETVREKLIAAAVELAAERSSPRLGGTRYELIRP